MPFIDSEGRGIPGLSSVARHVAQERGPGVLAYVLYVLLLAYVRDGRCRFQQWAEALGALRSVELMLLHGERGLLHYEQGKALQNGDIRARDVIEQEESVSE